MAERNEQLRQHLNQARRPDQARSQPKGQPAKRINDDMFERIEKRFMELDRRLRALEQRPKPRVPTIRPSRRLVPSRPQDAKSQPKRR